MTATDHQYRGYFASDEQRRWYESAAGAKAANVERLAASMPARPKRVLDVGAGSGAVLQRLHDQGFGEELHAVEISESGLAAIAARKAMGATRIRSVLPFDGIRIPHPDGAFDLAVLSHVLEHVDHPRLMLLEIRRVARALIVEVPLEDVPLRTSLAAPWVPDDTGHINYFRQETFVRLLETSGWRVRARHLDAGSRESAGFRGGKKGLLLHDLKAAALRVQPRLAALVLSYHCALLCERADHDERALHEVLGRRT